jgi:hypothetical protein
MVYQPLDLLEVQRALPEMTSPPVFGKERGSKVVIVIGHLLLGVLFIFSENIIPIKGA